MLIPWLQARAFAILGHPLHPQSCLAHCPRIESRLRRKVMQQSWGVGLQRNSSVAIPQPNPRLSADNRGATTYSSLKCCFSLRCGMPRVLLRGAAAAWLKAKKNQTLPRGCNRNCVCPAVSAPNNAFYSRLVLTRGIRALQINQNPPTSGGHPWQIRPASWLQAMPRTAPLPTHCLSQTLNHLSVTRRCDA